MADVEQITGIAVGFAFLRFYQAYPQIGVPLGEQQGDVGGTQTFANADLYWTGEKVEVRWTNNDEPLPSWMEGERTKQFEI